MRTYTELSKFQSFEERFEYLKDPQFVGEETFGYFRWLNQEFYNGDPWKKVRRKVIIRDDGCDLGIPGFKIVGSIIVHHMKPVLPEDILEHHDWILDPEFLISVSDATHRAITYGAPPPEYDLKERKPNDTIFWERRW